MNQKADTPEKLTWKCSNCGHTLEQQVPPDECPSCHENCEFLNVTCYIPECGGTEGGGQNTQLG